MSRSKILKSSSVLIIFTLLSRILGLIREVIKAHYLGTTALSDAFSIAFLIPNLLRRLFAEGTISAAFIPTFKGYLEKNDKIEIKSFISATITFATVIFVSTILLGIIFTPGLISIFGPELDENITNETILLTRIMFPYLFFISLAAFMQGILNSLHIFGPSGFTPILFNISFILMAIFLSPYTENPARALAIGVLIGGVIQLLFQLPYVIKASISFTFVSLRKAFTHRGTRKVLLLISPTILGMGAYQINLLFATRIANSAGTGVVSSLQFSNRLLELILGVFIISLGTVILPELSTNAKKKNWDAFNKNISFGIRLTALISIPATFFTLIMREEIVALLFKVGKFDENSVKLTSYALLFHICGLFFVALNRILSPAFFAQEDTKSPTIAGIISVICNIILAYSLVDSMKGGGIALASSLAALLNAMLLILMLFRSKIIYMNAFFNSGLYTVKMLIMTIIAFAPLFLMKSFIFRFFNTYNNKLISLGTPVFISFLLASFIFIIILAITKDEHLFFILSIIKRRIPWKK